MLDQTCHSVVSTMGRRCERNVRSSSARIPRLLARSAGNLSGHVAQQLTCIHQKPTLPQSCRQNACPSLGIAPLNYEGTFGCPSATPLKPFFINVANALV